MSATRNLATIRNIILLVSLLLLVAACMEEASKETAKTPEESLADSLAIIQAREADRLTGLTAQLEKAPIYFCSASLVSVRQEPNQASAEVDQVTLGEGLRFAGELGGDSTGIMLDEHVAIDQYALVLTPRGQIGWIHRGALKKDKPQTMKLSLPMPLASKKGTDLQGEAWKELFVALGKCEGAACPLYYTDAMESILLMEVCDPSKDYAAGIHIFYPHGKKRHFQWWEEDYARETCQNITSAKKSYVIEKMAKEGTSIKEIRLKFEFEDRYGEYLLELGDDSEPFILEEKTGSKDS